MKLMITKAAMKRIKRKIRRGGLPPSKYLNDEQVERLLSSLDRAAQAGSNRSIVNRFIILVLLYSGLRAEELMSLRIIDTPAGHSKPIIDVQEGKGCVARAVDIPDWFGGVINDFIKSHRPGAKPGSVLIASEMGFRTVMIKKVITENRKRTVVKRQERSARLTYQCLLERVDRIGSNAGFAKLTPHMLRHTFGTRLYAVSKDLLFVQQQLGHASPNTTMIYARTVSEDRRKQMNSLPVPVSFRAKT